MKLFFSETQKDHQPRQYMVHGRVINPLENPNRLDLLAGALVDKARCTRAVPTDHGRDAILKVHDPGYVQFLETIWDDWQTLPNHGPEVWPNVHPYRGAGPALGRREPPRTTGVIGRTGWYMGDLSCALAEGTWRAAYASAQTALAATQAVLDGDAVAFGLCRPPGHHAYVDRTSGFCFLNNAAIAAETLRTRHPRVAILDFDTHHGDGTQAIFYERSDILYASLHTDPSAYYPHYAGYADETGAGPGEGANLNLPLPQGAGDQAFLAAVDGLVEAVRRHGSEALVISAGWDAHEADPLSKLTVSLDAYPRTAEKLARLNLPTVILQEGGYALDVIVEAAPQFVTAFMGTHRP